MTWDDFWGWFKNLSEELQRDLLRQIDLVRVLASASSKVQVEIMRDAPKAVVASALGMLHEKVIAQLGYKSESLNMLKYVLR